jgi:hypothetical protein
MTVHENGGEQQFESVTTNTATIATELGLPEYDDVSNARQVQGRLVYATGDGASSEGIYKHDGSSYAQVGGGSSEWQEDGNGNIVPIDGETVGDGTTTADHQSVTTDDVTYSNSVTYPDGTTVTTSPGGGIWTEDGNSPSSLSGSSSYTFTLADTFDVVLISIMDFDFSGDPGEQLSMQVNGDTGSNYNRRGGDGGFTSGETNWPLEVLSTSNSVRSQGNIVLEIDGRWNKNVRMGNHKAFSSNNTEYGINLNVTSPLDQFSLFSGGTNFSATLTVLGRDG